jgi:hypothetical protein
MLAITSLCSSAATLQVRLEQGFQLPQIALEWDVDIAAAKLVVINELIVHDWTGEVKIQAPMGDYKQRFGYVC